MPTPTLLGLGTAVPRYCYKQMDICDELAPAFNNRRAPAVFRATQIQTRYSVLETPAWLVTNPGNRDRLARYMRDAPPLGIKAIQNALQQANLPLNAVDELIVVSCTGVDTPGLDVSIAHKLGMSPFVRRSTIVGMGCHALLPALRQAAAVVLARPQATALVLTLELCTLHFQHDHSLRNMLGSALFADGASAVMVGSGPGNGPRWLDSLSYSDYQTQGEMSFHPGDRGYVIHLSGRIPDILRKQVPPLVAQLLARHNLRAADINHWLVHPGGMKILDYLQQALDLEAHHLQHSRAVLRQYGNMSSATLLFVLERLTSHQHPAPGDYGLLLGFGPGLTVELGLVQW